MKKEVRKNPGNQVPPGVKIISIWHYIGAGILLLVEILFFLSPTFFQSLFPSLVAVSPVLFIVLGIISLILVILIARGLWRGQNWARIFVIVSSLFGFLDEVGSLASGIFSKSGIDIISAVISIAISGVVGGYLFFSKKVKKAFK